MEEKKTVERSCEWRLSRELAKRCRKLVAAIVIIFLLWVSTAMVFGLYVHKHKDCKTDECVNKGDIVYDIS